MPKLNLAIIFGGPNNEHDISLKTAKQVVAALDRAKYDLTLIAITKNWQWLIGADAEAYLERSNALLASAGAETVDLSRVIADINPLSTGLADLLAGKLAAQKIDLAIPLGHGFFMEDGRLQAILEGLGIKYMFSGVAASAIAMNKEKSKIIAKAAGLKVAKGEIMTVDKKYDTAMIVKKLGLPLMVKPNESGSSVGIAKATTEEELKAAIPAAFAHGNEIMIEQYIKGRELSVAVVDGAKGKALPVIEIIPKMADWFNYDSKYKEGGAEEVCPAQLDLALTRRVQKQAMKAYKAIGCRDMARVDFIFNEADNKFYFIEVNTIPGLTAQSLVPKAALAYGLEFDKFLDRLIKTRLK